MVIYYILVIQVKSSQGKWNSRSLLAQTWLRNFKNVGIGQSFLQTCLPIDTLIAPFSYPFPFNFPYRCSYVYCMYDWLYTRAVSCTHCWSNFIVFGVLVICYSTQTWPRRYRYTVLYIRNNQRNVICRHIDKTLWNDVISYNKYVG